MFFHLRHRSVFVGEVAKDNGVSGTGGLAGYLEAVPLHHQLAGVITGDPTLIDLASSRRCTQ